MMLDARSERLRQERFQQRLAIFMAGVVLIFSLLGLRFYHLQIIRGGYFRGLSENNRLTLVETRARRGVMLDRRGNVLADNRPSFSVSLVFEDVEVMQGTVEMLASVLDQPQALIRERVASIDRYRRFEPVRIAADISREQLGYLEAVKYQYPGVSVVVEPRRYYPHGSLAAHMLGTVGEIGRDELMEKGKLGYETGDYVGKTGLEKEYEDLLTGVDGGFQMEVDSVGRRLRVLNRQDPQAGYGLMLTLDLKAQRAAEEALGGRSGTVVAMVPSTGEILVACSHPHFDPNSFASGLSSEAWKELSENERHPMQNRVMQSQYPPGSVFKLVTATAGLAEQVIGRDEKIRCTGGTRFGGRVYRCWKKGGHGDVNLHRAIVESCDTFFYEVGQRVGIDRIASYARELGLDRQTGLELAGEWRGLIPDSDWKLTSRKEAWFPGETLSASIGQGYVLVTPLQMAVMISAIATDGEVPRPMLVRKLLSPSGESMRDFLPERQRQALVPPGVLEVVRRGMVGAVNEPHGTGWEARMKSLMVAGKTGTAQVVALAEEDEGRDENEIPEHLRDHAWFACYAPAEAPEVAVVVMVEHGGHGGSAGAPVARAVLEALFGDREAAPAPVGPGEA